MPLATPAKWTAEQLQADAERAKAYFRRERLDEPLELYVQQFDTFYGVFESLIDQLPELASRKFDPTAFAALVADQETRRALFYLTAPPISDDDLKTLADVPSFALGALTADPSAVTRIRDTLIRILDPKRFPWVAENRSPTRAERRSAINVSSALVAVRKVETFRRTDAKEQQGRRVKDLLRALKFNEVPKRVVHNAASAPKAGEFMGETPVVGTRADVVAGLHDGRLMVIECKVSNSSVNSYKRIVHDTGGKATIWYSQFGKANIVVAAVLSGVFAPANCELVQNEKAVFLIWDHRLEDLRDFIATAR